MITARQTQVRGAGGVPCVNPPMLKSIGAENGSKGEPYMVARKNKECVLLLIKTGYEKESS